MIGLIAVILLVLIVLLVIFSNSQTKLQAESNEAPTDNLPADMWVFPVKGLTHRQNMRDPKYIISQLQANEKVILVPIPDNKYDSTAIRVCTSNGVPFGWYPSKGYRSEWLFQFLTEKKPIRASVVHAGISKQGIPFCDICILAYDKQFLSSREQFFQTYQDISTLSEEQQNYFHVIKNILGEQLNGSFDTVGIIDNFFMIIRYPLYENRIYQFFYLKSSGRLKYLLINLPFSQIDSQLVDKWNLKPASKSEGGETKTRLPLVPIEEMEQYKELILKSFKYSWEHLKDL